MTDASTEQVASALDAELVAYGEDVILKDGGTVRLRALGPGDVARAAEFFRALSAKSRHYRFFGAVSELPIAEIKRMASLDPRKTIALAAVDGDDRIVGIAELATARTHDPAVQGKDERPRNEFAVAIADDHQDRGIGTLLLERMAAVARKAGIAELEAVVLAENRQMLDVFTRSGFDLKESVGAGSYTVTFPTAETGAAPRFIDVRSKSRSRARRVSRCPTR